MEGGAHRFFHDLGRFSRDGNEHMTEVRIPDARRHVFGIPDRMNERKQLPYMEYFPKIKSQNKMVFPRSKKKAIATK